MITNDNLAQIGVRLRKLREKRGLTQAELSRLMYCSQAELSRFENGSRVLTLRLFIQAIKVLRIEPSDLMRGRRGSKRGSKGAGS